jgi:hypothetical protein
MDQKRISVGYLRLMRQEVQDLLPCHAANFDSFHPASFAAKNTNSRPGRFQKLRQKFGERLVRAVFHRRGPQAHFQRPSHFACDLIFAGARLHTHLKGDGVARDVFCYFHWDSSFTRRVHTVRVVVRKSGGARRNGFPSARFQRHFLASQPRRTGAPLHVPIASQRRRSGCG